MHSDAHEDSERVDVATVWLPFEHAVILDHCVDMLNTCPDQLHPLIPAPLSACQWIAAALGNWDIHTRACAEVTVADGPLPRVLWVKVARVPPNICIICRGPNETRSEDKLPSEGDASEDKKAREVIVGVHDISPEGLVVHRCLNSNGSRVPDHSGEEWPSWVVIHRVEPVIPSYVGHIRGPEARQRHDRAIEGSTRQPMWIPRSPHHGRYVVFRWIEMDVDHQCIPVMLGYPQVSLPSPEVTIMMN
mmetsp:Transcript_14167/g.41748  ORF Transcript_14167/g.41748 Transcript_14167/m.41748 type:complete len:247 (+) Transcript_14167:271-1011(+)|eukprot:CAMPEP_0118974324 /NCGR_PEP_ID=MMETSP1173-20130426/11190_1 /TAXON_ID=1034831 /ORGANISM="Rhizochromulina marina cf, Strain CCMP1243" /LENGTH=246 /DNA_ID=CAMNT_0006924041 /DNA_START=217 /DNA_END=957 /DNA_ORIENTATION=+